MENAAYNRALPSAKCEYPPPPIGGLIHVVKQNIYEDVYEGTYAPRWEAAGSRWHPNKSALCTPIKPAGNY